VLNHWHPFWMNLKPAYDAFERTRLPPRVSVCNKRYLVTEADGASGVCVEDGSDGIPMPEAEPEREDAKVAKARKVASKAQSKPASGRSARKAYAEARRARLAAQTKRVRTSDAEPKRRSH
jgi:murein L,D-transpeptidase YafK